AAHQLCLFHETRRVTTAVDEVVRAVRAAVPLPPPATRRRLGGRRRKAPVAAEATDAATQRWRGRGGAPGAGAGPGRGAAPPGGGGIARVDELRRGGWSLRAIARGTGFNRRTVTAWLRREVPQALPSNRRTGPRTGRGSRPRPRRRRGPRGTRCAGCATTSRP